MLLLKLCFIISTLLFILLKYQMNFVHRETCHINISHHIGEAHKVLSSLEKPKHLFNFEKAILVVIGPLYIS